MSELIPTAISRPRPHDIVPGYKLLELVGKGGMGEVHRAVQLSLERRVAVKLLASNLAQEAGFVARFEKEAAALAQLSHPNIVSIVDKGKACDTYYLVMEFVEGPSLRELQKNGITPAAALRALADVARAIDYAHGRGIVHRDLKPENILIDAQAGNIAKVSDFGLAGFLEGQPNRFDVTATHVAMGTLAYMAPEQRVDAKNADARADIYSLGVMLYELLVGEPPMGSYSPPSAKVSGLDVRLDAVVERCLKPDPRDRYQKASELLADLEPSVQQLSVPPPSLTAVDRMRQAVRRAVRTATRTVEAVVVLAALSVLGAAVLRSRAPARPPELPAEAFDQELRDLSPVSVAARVENVGLVRRVRLGEGPDQLPLLPSGRPVTLAPPAIRIAHERRDPVGLAVLDLTEVPGQSVRLSARLRYAAPPLDLRGELRKAVFGEEPAPRVALALAGSTPARHAMIVVGPPGAPVALDWVFGDRRGVMLGPPSPAEGADAALEVDEKGNLRAFLGRGADRRAFGEPIALGPDWRKLFGRLPSPELGCAQANCGFREVSFEVERQPPPPAPPPPPAVAMISPEPAPQAPARPKEHVREKRPEPKTSSKREEHKEKREKKTAEREEERPRKNALEHVVESAKSLVGGGKKEKSERPAHKGREGR